MKRKLFLTAIFLGIIQFSAVSQNFNIISEIVESKQITVGQATYLTASYLSAIDDRATIDSAFEKVVSLGLISQKKKIQEPISLQELCSLFAKATDQNGGLLFFLTKKSPRYSYKEFLAKGYIPLFADPMMKVSGIDAIGLLNSLIEKEVNKWLI